MKVFLYSCLICLTLQLQAQVSFIQTTDTLESWLINRIAARPDGGYYVGLQLKNTDLSRPFLLASYDECDQIIWSHLYSGYVFDHMRRLPDGSLLVLLSDDNEVLLGRLTENGDWLYLKELRINNAGFVNVFSMDVWEDEVMLYGVVEAIGLQGTTTALIRLDQEGDLIWGYHYFNNIAASEASFDTDGTIICANSNLLYRIDQNGDILWARKFSGLEGISNYLSRPIPVTDGYISQARFVDGGDQRFLFKVSKTGDWMGNSEGWNSGTASVDLFQNDTSVMVPYPRFLNGVVQLAVSEADHDLNIKSQSQWEFVDENISLLFPEGQFLGDHSLIITGSTSAAGDEFDFLLRMPLEGEACQKEIFADLNPLSIDPAFEDSATAVVPKVLDIAINDLPVLLPGTFRPDPVDFCRTGQTILTNSIDTIIPCSGSYTFVSPIPEAMHFWEDGSTETTRILEMDGVYELEVIDCQTIYRYTIALDRDCACTIDLPNAFTPNNDGVNDEFAPIGPCSYQSYTLRIFNRWGQEVYSTRSPEDTWDGRSDGKAAASDVYVYWLEYTYLTENGDLEESVKFGDLSLIR
jgi:gliding motility-associated-like protein